MTAIPALHKAHFIKQVTKEIKGKTYKKIVQTDVKIIINRFLYEINHALLEKKQVHFCSFGNWRVIKIKSRFRWDMIRNKAINVPAKNMIRFVPSKKVLRLLWKS